MIRISAGDLVQISANNHYYYALILEKITYCGGQFCFAFYRTSETPLPAEEVLKEPFEGFYETVDFIWAKREKRIERITKKIDVEKLNAAVTHFKTTYDESAEKPLWTIMPRDRSEFRRTRELTEEEKRYPLSHRIDDIYMVELINERWSPEKDKNIK